MNIYHFSDVETKRTELDKGFDINNGKSIYKDDLHFGWKLGEFFISGYSEVVDHNNSLVFLKNYGDSITLTFDLQQNINELNKNKQLIISDDKNGYDQGFEVTSSKEGFGRGALIVQMTDYQNRKKDPKLYSDFLEAQGINNNDTSIVLAEEGDYEVALDYETQNNDVRSTFSKYNNYTMRFSFSVRNGNCIIFARDNETHSELLNTAIAENGFYLDFAKSRYLRTTVSRAEIVNGVAGLVEDSRGVQVARDGEKFTKTGIYTIKAVNQYTGESVTKKIFVGTEEDLEVYKENGFSIDQLK